MEDPTIENFELTVLRKVFHDALVANVVECSESYRQGLERDFAARGQGVSPEQGRSTHKCSGDI